MLSEQFTLITGMDFQVLSTVDHPYTSPPVRLLDSHDRLRQIHTTRKVCILNWDVSQPNDRTYRYDLQIDIGILAKNKHLFLFEKDVPFALQESNSLDLYTYDNILENILDRMTQHQKLSQDTATKMKNNYQTLRDNVLSPMLSSQGRLTTNFTQRSLVNFYALLGKKDLSKFIEDTYLYYYNSPLMKVWIPFCIENATGKRSFNSVMKADVFGRRIFRPGHAADINETALDDPLYVIDHENELVKLIQDGKIIPSIEVLYWALELGGKDHFGNDYGFFERYASHLGESLPNQLTAMNMDGVNYFQMKQDYGVTYDLDTGNFTHRGASSQVKESRINSMFAFYIFLGQKMRDHLFNPPKKTNTLEIVDGDIVLT